MKTEYNIITKKHWCFALANNYPDLTEEATMSPSELLSMGYDYEELIDRRETPYLSCQLRLENGQYIVFTRKENGWEKLGTVPRDYNLDDLVSRCEPIVRVDGGQKIKVVEGNHRDRKVEVYDPYRFVLTFRNVWRLKQK